MLFENIAFAMGAGPQAGAESSMSATLMNIAPLILIFVIFYFLLIRPQQKKTAELKKMINSLKVGDRVVTIGGFYGTIVEIPDVSSLIIDIGDTTATITKDSVAALVESARGNKPSSKDRPKKAKVGIAKPEKKAAELDDKSSNEEESDENQEEQNNPDKK